MASLITPDTTKTLATRAVKDVYAVSRLVREARVALEGTFPLLWVEGEISNLAMPASGHIYFTLKDEIAQVRCAMFRNRNRQLRFTPKNGMQVLLRVRVTLYEGRGEFQLSVEHMEEAGSGALQRAYEALKFRLGEEGLFAQEHKQTLPSLPETIGVISSPDGAAVHDILTVLNRRFPATNVIIYPSSVQGTGSVEQLLEAISLAEQRQEVDLLIIGRGGGSLEDLWSFNDEKLARRIFACSIPIISAVGHEVDFTIADFVTDVRAATPSAAAEIAVPDSRELLAQFTLMHQRLGFLMSETIQKQQRHLSQLVRLLPKPQQQLSQLHHQLQAAAKALHRNWQQGFNQQRQKLDMAALRLSHPQAKIERHQHRVAGLANRLQYQADLKIQQSTERLNLLIKRLQIVSPLLRIKQKQHQFAQLEMRLSAEFEQGLQNNKANLVQLMRTLSAVSPLNTLERGYSITTQTKTDAVVHCASELEVGQTIKVRLQQGRLDCEVKAIHDD